MLAAGRLAVEAQGFERDHALEALARALKRPRIDEAPHRFGLEEGRLLVDEQDEAEAKARAAAQRSEAARQIEERRRAGRVVVGARSCAGAVVMGADPQGRRAGAGGLDDDLDVADLDAAGL